MELKDAIFKRASIRKYKDIQVTNEQIEELMKAAMASPSGINARPYRFIVVRGKETLAKLKEADPRVAYNAPAVIIVVGNKEISPNNWTADCAAATENILLRAVDLGLGTCWCASYPYPNRMSHIKSVLPFAPSEDPYSFILLGVPDEDKSCRGIYDPARVTIID